MSSPTNARALNARGDITSESNCLALARTGVRWIPFSNKRDHQWYAVATARSDFLNISPARMRLPDAGRGFTFFNKAVAGNCLTLLPSPFFIVYLNVPSHRQPRTNPPPTSASPQSISVLLNLLPFPHCIEFHSFLSPSKILAVTVGAPLHT